MKISGTFCEDYTKVFRKLMILTAVSIFTALFSSCATAPQPGATATATATPTPARQLSEEEKQRKGWGDQMLRKPAPKKGCFDAAYPSTEWKEVPCVKSPNIPAIPRHGPRPAVVGSGDDIAAQALSGHITQAIGHFED